MFGATYPYSTSSLSSADVSTAAGIFAGAFLGTFIISLIIGLAINLALTWGVYKKGGYKGWEGIIPIYNTWCLCKMAKVETWAFVVSLFFPIFLIYVYIKLAEQFGKDVAWGIGLTFLPFIFMPILGYGSAEYKGAAPVAPEAPKAPEA